MLKGFSGPRKRHMLFLFVCFIFLVTKFVFSLRVGSINVSPAELYLRLDLACLLGHFCFVFL